MILAFSCIISLIILTLKKKLSVPEIGKNSMIPYIAHGFLLKALKSHTFSFYTNLYFTFIGGLVFSLLVISLFGRDSFSVIYDKLMKKITKFITKQK